MADNDDLLDYEDEEQNDQAIVDTGIKKDVKGTYVSIHSSGFRDFLLKPEILRAIVDCGFEHPSAGNIFHDIMKFRLNIKFPSSSSTRMHSTSSFRHGYSLSSKIRHG